MAAHRRRNLAISRRRIDEEGEDEDLGVDDVDDSQSDASLLSDDQDSADGSELSVAGDATPRKKEDESSKSPRSSRKAKHATTADVQESSTHGDKAQGATFTATADMDAMQKGLTTAGHVEEGESIAFEDAAREPGPFQEPPNDAAAVQDSTGKKESYVTRARREGPALKDKGPANPAFVPNRGGFFMHDYRNDSGNQPGFGRGRGRGSGPPGNTSGNGNTFMSEPKMDRWNHDLHEANVTSAPPAQTTSTRATLSNQARSFKVPAAQVMSPSRTISLGTVLIRILLPLMDKPINFPKTPVKQHTRLPDLRPPLRRDKPVRISIPGQPPKYVFPNVERSFVFIPRSQRPNHQNARGSIRNSLQGQGSRRASIYGGSSYAASTARSEHSSQAHDSIMSPTGITMASAQAIPFRPVVRLPAGAISQKPVLPTPIPQPHTPVSSEMADDVGPLAPGIPQQQNHVDQLEMHQPRPQKTVSVASIESPAPLHFHAPMQQEQQPFHHQVPAHMSSISSQGDPNGRVRQLSFQSQLPSSTPLSNIAERALHAQPFQPLGMQQAQYYQPVYPMQNYYYYPQMGVQADAYDNSMAAWNTGMNVSEETMAGTNNMYAHESNGMVYYYNPPQAANNVDGLSTTTSGYDGGASGATIVPGQDGFTYNQTGQAVVYYPASIQ